MEYYKNLKIFFDIALYLMKGKRPWSRGYQPYKELLIKKIIMNHNFEDLINKDNYGRRIDERIVEYPWFFSKLAEEPGTLLDAGSILNYDYIINLPKLHNKTIHIVTLAPEINCFWKKRISYIYEDLRTCPYRDNYFDNIVSISTIEHIGLDNTMLYSNDKCHKEASSDSYLYAIREFKRMLKPNSKLFLTVPFGEHKNHGWFQVFDSLMIDNLISEFEPTKFHEECFKYNDLGWHRSNRQESKYATYFDIHSNNKFDRDFAAASRAVICLELTK